MCQSLIRACAGIALRLAFSRDLIASPFVPTRSFYAEELATPAARCACDCRDASCEA